MPTVLTTNKTTNHPKSSFLAAFHKAIPFQTTDQINKMIRATTASQPTVILAFS